MIVGKCRIMNLSAKRVGAYLLLGLGFSVVMGFMYMQYVYYDAMIETLNISNITLPNVRDAQSFVSGLRELAQQYVARRS